MARLNEIEVRESSVTYSNKRDWFFHPSAHHVRELLRHFLPRDFTLDGSSKLSVSFGPCPPGEAKCSSVLGVTMYYVDPFDVPQYMRLPIERQQEIILDELTKTMVAIAESCGGDPTIIHAAAASVRRAEFAAEIRIDKLCRSTADRRLRVEVFRRLGPAVGEVWEARVMDRSGVLSGIEPMTPNPHQLDHTTHFSRSRWNGSVFEVIYSRLDQIRFTLDTAKYA